MAEGEPRLPAMTPEQLRAILADVAARAARLGVLPDAAEAGPPAGPLFRPVDGRPAGVVADWVTPVTQRWAPQLSLEPRALGRVLAQGLTEQPSIEAVEVAPSGLLAITLTDEARAGILEQVLAPSYDAYGDADDDALDGSREPNLPSPTASTDAGPLRSAQLAHARLRRLARNAEAAGVEASSRTPMHELTRGSERLLLVALADLPQRLHRHEGDLAQQVRAVVDLGEVATDWTHPVRPLVEGEAVEPIHAARLVLARAAAVVLRNGLARLGATAPERM